MAGNVAAQFRNSRDSCSLRASMRTLVLCDDRAHPATLTRGGLAPLAGSGYEFDWIEDPDTWSAEAMRQYRVVVFSKANNRSTTDAAPWAAEQEGSAFADYVADGNGILFLHSGTALYDDSPSLCRLMGGTFAGHPPQCEVTVEPAAGHPLTAGCTRFAGRDEHYQMAMNDPHVELFLHTASEHGTEPGGWTRTHGKGRVCVLTPGHNLPIWLQPSYQRLLRNCLAWCAGETDTGVST